MNPNSTDRVTKKVQSEVNTLRGNAQFRFEYFGLGNTKFFIYMKNCNLDIFCNTSMHFLELFCIFYWRNDVEELFGISKLQVKCLGSSSFYYKWNEMRHFLNPQLQLSNDFEGSWPECFVL